MNTYNFPIYLDNNATTQPTQEVVAAVAGAMEKTWANPSSPYSSAKEAFNLVAKARETVARSLGVSPLEITFTSGGTESINTAIQGLAAVSAKKHIITTTVEHAATLESINRLESTGYEVTRLNVFDDGEISLREFEDAIRPDTAFASLMLANNETGVVFPMEEIAGICRRKKVLLHVDAVQALGKIPLTASLLSDVMSVSAHKIHGPKGIGALYIRRHMKLKPLLVGGDQENGHRAGTENVPGIAGFGIAAQQAMANLEGTTAISKLRDNMEHNLLNKIPCIVINGNKTMRLPNTSSITISGANAKELVAQLAHQNIFVSAGSACSTGSPAPSHVILAMGKDAKEALSTIRISLSRYTTAGDLQKFTESLANTVATLRNNRVQAVAA